MDKCIKYDSYLNGSGDFCHNRFFLLVPGVEYNIRYNCRNYCTADIAATPDINTNPVKIVDPVNEIRITVADFQNKLVWLFQS